MSDKLIDKLEEIKQDKDTNLLPENLKKGVTCLGVEGTLETGGGTDVPVKLFETVEEMQADETAKEGDLALVYGKQTTRRAIKEDILQNLYFPDIVVLPAKNTSTITSDILICNGPSRGNIYISDTEFTFRYDGLTIGTIQYISDDGITYTKNDSADNNIKLSYPSKIERWYDAFGYFINIDTKEFNGLYTYSTIDNSENHIIFSNINIQESTYDTSNETLALNDYNTIIKLLTDYLHTEIDDYQSLMNYLLEKINDTTYKAYFYIDYNTTYALDFISDIENIYLGERYTRADKDIYAVEIDLSNNIVNPTKMQVSDLIEFANGEGCRMDEIVTSDRKFILTNVIYSYIKRSSDLDIYDSYSISFKLPKETAYHFADTQLTNTTSAEINKNNIILSKNGIINGERQKFPRAGIVINDNVCLNTSRNYRIDRSQIFSLLTDKYKPYDSYYDADSLYLGVSVYDLTGYPYKSFDEVREVKITLKDKDDNIVFTKDCTGFLYDNGSALYHDDFTSVLGTATTVLYGFSNTNDLSVDILSRVSKLELTFLNFD